MALFGFGHGQSAVERRLVGGLDRGSWWPRFLGHDVRLLGRLGRSQTRARRAGSRSRFEQPVWRGVGCLQRAVSFLSAVWRPNVRVGRAVHMV